MYETCSKNVEQELRTQLVNSLWTNLLPLVYRFVTTCVFFASYLLNNFSTVFTTWSTSLFLWWCAGPGCRRCSLRGSRYGSRRSWRRRISAVRLRGLVVRGRRWCSSLNCDSLRGSTVTWGTVKFGSWNTRGCRRVCWWST